MPEQQIIYGTYPHSLPAFAGGHRTVNMFAQRAEGQARAPLALTGAPGMKEFADASATITGQPCRGWVYFNGTWYVVIGGFLFSVASDGTLAQIVGTIAGSGRVQMAGDNDELIITTRPGTDDYLFDGSTLSQFTGANIVDFRSVAHIDGHNIYIPSSPTTAGEFRWSNVNTMTVVDADNSANAESEPDALLRVEVINRGILFFGGNTLERYYSTGASPVFSRDSDNIEPYGLAAHDSVAALGRYGFFLAVSEKAAPHVRMIEGARSERVSTDALDEIIAENTYSDATGTAFERNGHLQYALTLPTHDRTFVFDASLGINPPIWHERQSGVELLGSWDARQIVFAHGKTLCGHVSDGKLYELDKDTQTDAGSKRMAMFTVEIKSSGEFFNIMDAVIAEMTVGRAALDATAEPVVMLDWSDDFGKTWSPEIQIGLGFAGDYSRIAEERGLGEFLTRIMRFRVTDTVPREVVKVFARGRRGRAA